MKLEEIKSLYNLYDYSTHRLEKNKFVGRKEHIETIRAILDEYLKTTKLKNIVINGEKSIGKSALLYKFKQILEDYSFVTYEVEFSKDPQNKIDEFDFFEEFSIFYLKLIHQSKGLALMPINKKYGTL